MVSHKAAVAAEQRDAVGRDSGWLVARAGGGKVLVVVVVDVCSKWLSAIKHNVEKIA